MARKAVARNNLFDPRWSVWGAAYGGELKADGNAAVGSRDASTRAFGFAAGADYRLSPNTLVGFAMSGGGTSFSLAQSGGSGRSDVFQAGAFIRHNIGQGYIKGAIAYGWHDVTTDRTVTVAGLDQLEGRYNANSLGVRGEARLSIRHAVDGRDAVCRRAGDHLLLSRAMADQVALGLNTFALNYASRDITSARTELGLRTDKSFALQTALVTLRGRAAWAHYFDDNRALTASFQTLAGTCLRRHRRRAGARRGARQRLGGREVDQRLLARRRVRGRVLRPDPRLRGQGHCPLLLVVADHGPTYGIRKKAGACAGGARGSPFAPFSR